MMKNKYKVLIITCWILLILCCIAKLFGANWFIAHTDNQRFIEACNYINETYWFNFIVRFTINYISCSIYYMSVLRQNKLTLNSIKWAIPLAIYIVFKIIYNELDVLFFIFDVVMMIGLPIVIEHNKKILLFAPIGFILNTLFQLISMWLKVNQYTMFDNDLLVGIILSIDYYIMLILYWLYSIRFFKEKEMR